MARKKSTSTKKVSAIKRNVSKKKSAVVKINISKPPSGKLLEQGSLRPKSTDRFNQIITLSVILGILVGIGIIGYFSFYATPLSPDTIPNIIIPENELSGLKEVVIPVEAVAEEPEPVVVRQEVEILDTPTGYLNVRQGPGTNFVQIGRISPGEVYFLVTDDQEHGWFEIELAEGSTGWVTKQYARVK